MVRRLLSVCSILWSLAISLSAFAQIPPAQVDRPSATASAATGEGLSLEPRYGQTANQQWADRYECHKWATSQTGFDPSQQAPGTPGNATLVDQYRRALAACLEGHGYAVRYAAPQPANPPSPASTPVAVPAPVRVRYAQNQELQYHPFAFQISGGDSITAGTTNQDLEDGPIAGLGITWFPTSALPLGLRVDGSYSWFRAKSPLLAQGGTTYTSGHEEFYGADADAQLDLAHRSSRAKFYLVGGFGKYREQTYLRQVSFISGTGCDFYYCGPGIFPVITAEKRSTSAWRNSWNAGAGWELALDQHTSFFIEARYRRIAPYGEKMEFVPITIGLRF